MKKIIMALILTFLIVGAGFIYARFNTDKETNNTKQVSTLTFSFDDDDYGMYTGFLNLPDNYTLQDAVKDGYFVMKNNEMKANKEKWDEFVENTKSGNDSAIRIVKLHTDDGTQPCFIDVFFNDGKYYLFNSTAIDFVKHPFNYLLQLEGKFGSPLKDGAVAMLTDNNELTYNQFNKALFSSDSDSWKVIGRFEIIFFQ